VRKNKMKVKELIKKLQECDQELEVRLEVGMVENFWLEYVDEKSTGLSGYEEGGEVILGGTE
tara:strand:- start:491 stop:676 length:186 start_codon:yes stop_codon:yes gene_type:complete